MKKRTRWKRVYNSIIGIRFFDYSEYGLGFFTIEKLYRCKEWCKSATTPNGSHWFDKTMMQVRTESGLVYKMPFVPWMKVYDESGKKSLSDYYDENCCMSRKKL